MPTPTRRFHLRTSIRRAVDALKHRVQRLALARVNPGKHQIISLKLVGVGLGYSNGRCLPPVGYDVFHQAEYRGRDVTLGRAC